VTSGLAGPHKDIRNKCLAWPTAGAAGPDNYLRRPGLPFSEDIIDILRPVQK
jgi:hypothetical protein